MRSTSVLKKSLPVVAFVLLLGYIGVVLLLHIVPTENMEIRGVEVGGGVRLTHLLHAAMFIPWGILGIYYVYSRRKYRVRRVIGWVALGLAFAVFSETIQYWIPHRNFKLIDLFLNVAGVLLGSLAILGYHYLECYLFRG